MDRPASPGSRADDRNPRRSWPTGRRSSIREWWSRASRSWTYEEGGPKEECATARARPRTVRRQGRYGQRRVDRAETGVLSDPRETRDGRARSPALQRHDLRPSRAVRAAQPPRPELPAAWRARRRRARRRVAWRRERFLRRHGPERAARIRRQERRGEPPSGAALRRDLRTDATHPQADRGGRAGPGARGGMRIGHRVRPRARHRIREVRLSGGAAGLRPGDRHDPAQAHGGREGRIRPRGHGTDPRRLGGGGAGARVARIRGLGFRGPGERGVARPGRRQPVRAGIHQTAVLPARRRALRRGDPAGSRRERGEPHDSGLPRRVAGVPQKVTRFFTLKAWLGGTGLALGLAGMAGGWRWLVWTAVALLGAAFALRFAERGSGPGP